MKKLFVLMTMATSLFSLNTFASNICYSNKLDRPVVALTFYASYLKFVQPVAEFPYSEDKLAYGDKLFVNFNQAPDADGFRSIVLDSKHTSTFTFKFNLKQKNFMIVEKDSDDSSETIDTLSCDVTDRDINGNPDDMRS